MRAMVQTRVAKAYVLGLSIGPCWLISAGAGFAIYSIARMEGHPGLIAVLVGALMLLAARVDRLLRAVKLPSEASSASRQKIRRWFAWIVALEIAAVVLVNIGRRLTGHLSLTDPLTLVVIGIHFLPLARLFSVPRYTALGLLFCVISILTLLVIPAGAHVGAAMTRSVYVWLGCAAALRLISIANLPELRRLRPRQTCPISFSDRA
jgi:hypothetical protein